MGNVQVLRIIDEETSSSSSSSALATTTTEEPENSSPFIIHFTKSPSGGSNDQGCEEQNDGSTIDLSQGLAKDPPEDRDFTNTFEEDVSSLEWDEDENGNENAIQNEGGAIKVSESANEAEEVDSEVEIEYVGKKRKQVIEIDLLEDDDDEEKKLDDGTLNNLSGLNYY